MSPVIERIEDAGPDRRARRLVLSDFEEPRLTSASVVKILGIEAGDIVERAVLERQLVEHESECARERALRVLGYRERSSKELAKRLKDDGYPSEVVASLVARFVELGLVDDARFASSWARTRVHAGFGRERVRRELAEKGIEQDIATEALDEALGDEDPVERARVLLGNSPLESRSDRDRAVRKLVRRGFDLRTALRATEREDD